MKKVIAFDIGGTAIKYALATTAGELLTETEMFDTPKTKEEFVTEMTTIIEAKKADGIAGVSFSMPGFVNSDQNTLEQAGALRYLANANIDELFAHVHLPFAINNDARAVAIAEGGAGHAMGCDNFACITIGTGIGAGFVVNGEMVTGNDYKGGEYGKSVALGPDGNFYNHHQLASMSSLIYRYKLALGLDMATSVDGRDIFTEGETNPVVAQIIDEWYGYIAVLLYNLAVTFDPEKILIGGGVSKRHDLIEKIEEKLHQIVIGGVDEWAEYAPKLETCKFFNDSGVIGAAVFFGEKYQ